MGKDVAKVVAELQAEEADRSGLFSNREYGRRQRWSAIKVVAIKVH